MSIDKHVCGRSNACSLIHSDSNGTAWWIFHAARGEDKGPYWQITTAEWGNESGFTSRRQFRFKSVKIDDLNLTRNHTAVKESILWPQSAGHQGLCWFFRDLNIDISLSCLGFSWRLQVDRKRFGPLWIKAHHKEHLDPDEAPSAAPSKSSLNNAQVLKLMGWNFCKKALKKLSICSMNTCHSSLR